MNIVVFLKQVLDNTKLRFNESGPVTDGVPMMLNPYDEYALETALRLKEAAGAESTLTVISCGAGSAKEMIKKAIAVGADAAFLVNNETLQNADSTTNARVLAQAVKTLVPNYNLLIFGQSSLDDAAGQTGPKVAELLGVPSLSYCKASELAGANLKVTRETERGQEVHEMTLPGAICLMKCDYELRGSNIKGVMKANKTEIPVKTPEELGLSASDLTPTTKVIKQWQRPEKTAGKVISGADAQSAVNELLSNLKEAKIL